MVGRHVERKCIFGSFLYLIKSNSRDVGSCINELNSDYSNFAHFFFIRFFYSQFYLIISILFSCSYSSLPPSHLKSAFCYKCGGRTLGANPNQHHGSPPIMWRLVIGTVGCWYRFIWAPNA